MNGPTLQESWTKGRLQYNLDLIEPVFFAQRALDGWTKSRVMKAYRMLQIIFRKWAIENGQPAKRRFGAQDNSEPWRQAGNLANDPADLLFRILLPDSYSPLEMLIRDIGRQRLFAVFTIGEAAQADVRAITGYGSDNIHTLAALKAARWLAREMEQDQAKKDQEQLWETYKHIGDAAERGRRVLRGAKRGHISTHGTEENKRDKWAAYKATFDDLHAKHPHLSYEELKRRTAKKHGRSSKTIGRHCPNPNAMVHKKS